MEINPTILVLCGGKGERLKPLTNKTHKSLTKIDNKTILQHLVEFFTKKKLKKFIFTTGYKSKQIKNYLKKNFVDLEYDIVDSGNVNIINRLKQVYKFKSMNTIICYGDTLANINIIDLYNFHNNNNAIGTVSSYQIQSQFGILNIDKNGLVNDFMEKPKLDAWINIGFFIFNKKVFNIKAKNFSDLIAQLAHSGYLYSFKHKGLHITVNTLTELKQAEKDIKNFS